MKSKTRNCRVIILLGGSRNVLMESGRKVVESQFERLQIVTFPLSRLLSK